MANPVWLISLTQRQTMSVELTNFVTVFRTGQLVHLDWAANALKEAGIPLQQREETSGGLRVAMPVAPSTGPGQLVEHRGAGIFGGPIAGSAGQPAV